MIETPPEAEQWPEAAQFGAAVYPWADWADGRERVASSGEHFQSTPAAFAQGARAWAERNGFTAKVAQRGERVWFAFHPDPAGRMSPREIMAKYLDDELIPDPKGWISQEDVLAGYAEWHRLHPSEPKASRRQILAGVRASYPLQRRFGVVGYAGAR